MPFKDSRTGFLGPTSFSAVYTENSNVWETPELQGEESIRVTTPAEKIRQGVEVLCMLRDLPIYRKFVQKWFELCEGVIVYQPIFQVWMDELWSEFGQILEDGNPEQLHALSELVWRNTRRPMKVHGSMTAREWAKSASGRNLRWETCGMILSQAGLIAANLSSWDTIFDSIRERYGWLRAALLPRRPSSTVECADIEQ